MDYKSFARKLIRTFALVTVGICIVVFFPMDVSPTPILLFQIIILGVLCTMVSLVLYSEKEPSKRSYLLRHAIHLIATIALVIGYSVVLGWAKADKIWQLVGIGISVVLVTVFVVAVTYLIDRRNAARIQKGLERYKKMNK